jgi:hypothetical protein
MKRSFLTLLLAVFSMHALSDVAVSPEDLIERGGKYYLVSDSSLFSGSAVSYYSNGQPRLREEFREGVKEGKEHAWYENGNLKSIVVYKAGEPQGYGSSWYKDTSNKKESTSSFLACVEMDKSDAAYSKLCGSGYQPTHMEFADPSIKLKPTFP